MNGIQQHLDLGTRVVIVITFVLFVVALFIKGFGHSLLLEAGVFLVSVKLIVMAYKNSVASKDLGDRLSRMETSLTRIEDRLEPRSPSGSVAGSPGKVPQPQDAVHR